MPPGEREAGLFPPRRNTLAPSPPLPERRSTEPVRHDEHYQYLVQTCARDFFSTYVFDYRQGYSSTVGSQLKPSTPRHSDRISYHSWRRQQGSAGEPVRASAAEKKRPTLLTPQPLIVFNSHRQPALCRGGVGEAGRGGASINEAGRHTPDNRYTSPQNKTASALSFFFSKQMLADDGHRTLSAPPP